MGKTETGSNNPGVQYKPKKLNLENSEIPISDFFSQKIEKKGTNWFD